MEGVIDNLLFDDNHNLVGVVDWEWSRVVPAQFLVPPIWLTGSALEGALFWHDAYNHRVGQLVSVVREHEKKLNLPPLLSKEWAPMETW
jgi:hypothetical protein